MNLTRNIKLEELTNLPWAAFSAVQQLMLKGIADRLQIVRDLFKSPIIIHSCVRTAEDYARLQKAGYNPSETSDHYFGFTVTIKNEEKIKKYGNPYTLSVGAVDFHVKEFTNETVFERLKITRMYGQLIMEKGNGMSWIHMSNPFTLIYSDLLAQTIGKPLKPQYLVSTDAGKTYGAA